jgi:beta-lactamase regulating signal transducer with metallopeptidase domain
MREQVVHAVYYTEIHLIFCSLVWLCAWGLTSISSVSATTKHWIWVATALNFVLPLGAVLDGLLAAHISWATPIDLVGALGASVAANTAMVVGLAAVWLIGATTMLARLCARIATEYRSDHSECSRVNVPSSRSFQADGVPVGFGRAHAAPAVTGLLLSRISLPVGIDRLLSERELESVLMHEVTHARRHDNLIRLLYELSLCLLWFHPLVWITGRRIALYRELSCDEAVIQRGLGQDLVRALAKLVDAAHVPLLQATATSFFERRLAHLTADPRSRLRRAANCLSAMCFAVVLVGGVFATVSATACCFVTKLR